MCKTETWLPVVGYEGRYAVSDHGRVRSLERTALTRGGGSRPIRDRILKQASQGRYLVVGLCRDGRMKSRGVHRIVLEAFVGPPAEGQQALHWDDDPTNNRLPNLRWGSPQENARDCIRNGRNWQSVKTHCPQKHEYTDENTYVTPSTGGRGCRACMKEREDAKRGPHARDRTRCPQGHPYDEANTYLNAGRRNCRICARRACREHYHRQKALRNSG